jgi:hypothetical protein
MAYFIFLKYLDSLEDFRKNPHVKIPPKSISTNFQSFVIFKNQIVIRKRIFFLTFGPIGPAASRPIRPFGPAAAHFFPFQPAVSPPPPLSPQAQLALSAEPTVRRWRPARLPPPSQENASPRAAFATLLADRWAPPVITFLRRRPISTPRRHLVEPTWLPHPPPRPLSLWPTVTTP